MQPRRHRFSFILAIGIAVSCALPAAAQQRRTAILSASELARVVPSGFYFEGRSAPTQMRNAAGVRVDDKDYVIAALVDTSGYSTDVRAKYEGFLITDREIRVGGDSLGTGSYGFGFAADGRFNIYDISGHRIASAEVRKDASLRRPRPLMMSFEGGELRLYSGRSYVVIEAR
jgi:hypothetical protein